MTLSTIIIRGNLTIIGIALIATGVTIIQSKIK